MSLGYGGLNPSNLMCFALMILLELQLTISASCLLKLSRSLQWNANPSVSSANLTASM